MANLKHTISTNKNWQNNLAVGYVSGSKAVTIMQADGLNNRLRKLQFGQMSDVKVTYQQICCCPAERAHHKLL